MPLNKLFRKKRRSKDTSTSPTRDKEKPVTLINRREGGFATDGLIQNYSSNFNIQGIQNNRLYRSTEILTNGSNHKSHFSSNYFREDSKRIFDNDL